MRRFERRPARLGFEIVENRQTFAIQALESTPKNGTEQAFLASEMIVRRGKIDPCRRRDRAHRCAVKAVLHESGFGGIQNAFARLLPGPHLVVGCAGSERQPLRTNVEMLGYPLGYRFRHCPSLVAECDQSGF